MGRDIYNIINDMAEVLNASQLQKLQEVLVNRLSENNAADYMQTGNEEFWDMFLTAKHLEGCSDKTVRYYRCNIEKMLEIIDIPVVRITTEMLRKYLVEYQAINNCGKVTIDYIRRSLSTFFSWLEEEDYIIKSPMKRIHKVKLAIVVKDIIPNEREALKEHYAKPISMENELGSFVLDREFSWFEGIVNWNGAEENVYLETDEEDGDTAEQAMKVLKRIVD